MSSESATVFQSPYNFTYYSPLHAEVRSITDFRDYELLKELDYSVYFEGTGVAGIFSVGAKAKEKFVEASFYKDELVLTPLADDFIQIYE